jgi:hypothetical protein
MPGEQQADIPLEVEQQHPDSHGGTNGKSKNNASTRALVGHLSVMAQSML